MRVRPPGPYLDRRPVESQRSSNPIYPNSPERSPAAQEKSLGQEFPAANVAMKAALIKAIEAVAMRAVATGRIDKYRPTAAAPSCPKNARLG
jgi:hypothetical protein